MAVRVVQRTTNANAEKGGVEYIDTSLDQRETTVDGYTYHWGSNEVRNFLDQGVGAAHAAFGAIGVEEDIVPFGSSRS